MALRAWRAVVTRLVLLAIPPGPMESLGDRAHRLGPSGHADPELLQLWRHAARAVVDVVNLAELMRHIGENSHNRWYETALLVGHNADDGDLHGLSTFEERHDIIFSSERLPLTEEWLTRQAIPNDVQDWRGVVKLHTINDQQNPTLCAQALSHVSLVAPGEPCQGKEHSKETPNVPFAHRNTPGDEVPSNPTEGVGITKVPLAHLDNDVEAIVRVRECKQEVLDRSVNPAGTCTALHWTTPIVANHLVHAVKPMHETCPVPVNVKIVLADLTDDLSRMEMNLSRLVLVE